MPLPVFLLLTQDRVLQLVAWALYVAIGVTDYFDGMLARKYGSTRFGRLTDPIADKIYVALMFLPLALLDYMPAWAAVAILMRDPIITALRSLSERYGMTMKTATLAKYKTAIQMIAGGYIMFVAIVREKPVVLVCMTLLAILAWASYMYKGVSRKNWDPRLLTMGFLMTAAVIIRSIFAVQTTLILYTLIILVVTWISAWNYFWGFLTGLGGAEKKARASWWLLYGVEAAIVPLFLLTVCFHPHVPSWIPMTVLSLELAVGAMDNILTAEGHERSARHVAIKLALQLCVATGLVVVTVGRLAWPWLPVPPSLILACVFGLISVTMAVVAFLRYAPRIL